MFAVDDALDAIFLGAFLFGLLFTALSLILGAAHIGADHGGDIGHDGNGHDASHVNLSTILAFIAWFGGIGYLAHNGAGWTAFASVLVAIAGGLAGGYLIYQLFARVIRPSETAPLDPRDFELQGKLARVSSSVLAGGTGEITYVQNGARMVRAARAADGRAIPRGTDVIVLRAERGIGIVAPWDELVYGEAPPQPEYLVDLITPDKPSQP
jgi:hypothetical protein